MENDGAVLHSRVDARRLKCIEDMVLSTIDITFFGTLYFSIYIDVSKSNPMYNRKSRDGLTPFMISKYVLSIDDIYTN